jgi:hypothetical protein
MKRGKAVNRINLTSQEVAALLRGLSQGETDLGAEAEPEVPRPPAALAGLAGPAGPGLRERRAGQGLRKISHWWAAITELQWPQF